MIDPKSRSKEWILESCEKNKVNDPTLMEKTIRAFSLLEALAKSGCPFLFKGGSALMLQLACTQRLSVDIDIVCPPGTDVISYLEPYAEEYGFGEIVPTERISRNNVPKTHAKCYYQVSYITNTISEKILLSMIHFTKGNMMTSSAEALVNTVNTVGVMGKGIALQFKEEFPKNFLTYKLACSSGELTPFKLLITKELNSNGEEKIIINFPTKLHWRNPSEYEYIIEGLKELTKAISEHNIKSIAIPPLGCGNGGLDWNIVKGMIEEALKDVECEIYIYEHNTEIKQTLQAKPKNKEVKLTPSRGLITYAMYYYDSWRELQSVRGKQTSILPTTQRFQDLCKS